MIGDWMLVPLFFATALAYASVGFGGGTTYIALLALAGVSYVVIPQISLVCNLVVVAGGCYHLWRAGCLPLRRLAPFLLTSIPAAFVGGRIPVSKEIFFVLLGVTLFLAGVHLLWASRRGVPHEGTYVAHRGIEAAVGAVLGLLSGIVGIGGGIFLSPLLYEMKWGHAREIAAAASLFILLNSLAGVAGQFLKSGWSLDPMMIVPLVLAVVVGGQIGSRLASRRLAPLRMQQLTAVFIISVAVRLLWKAVA